MKISQEVDYKIRNYQGHNLFNFYLKETYKKEIAMIQRQMNNEITLHDVLEQLSTSDFIIIFLHIKYQSKKQKWYPHPEQIIMLDAMDAASRVKNATFWLMKSRQAAGTSMVAARLIKKCLAKNGYQVLVMSKSGDQAEKFLNDRLVVTLNWLYEYSTEINWPKYKGWKRYKKPTKAGKIEFPNGSVIEAINSALHAGRGDTVDEVVLDEAAAGEFLHHFNEIWGSITGGTEHSASGFKTVLSTSEPGSPFNARSKEYYTEPKKGIFFHFMGRNAIPKEMRTQEWWEQRVAELGQVRATLEYPETIDDCFVSNEGFVFPQFEKPMGRHVKSQETNLTYIFGTTYDHGRTKEHPAVIWYWLFNRFEDQLHVFKEHFWFEPQGGVNEICAGMNEDLFALRAQGFAKPSRNVADTAITNDDGRQSIRDMIYDKTGIYFNPAQKHDEKQSLDHLISRVNENRITFDPSCVNSRRQFSELMWSTKTDRYGKANDLDNDSIDVGRYCDSDLRLAFPKKDFKPMPPRYSRANKIWREKTSIKAIAAPTIKQRDWQSE
jgi:hypothetical protein